MPTTLRLYNTLTRQLEELSSIEPGHVRLYTCGPTVYDYAHIGNLRTFLFEDILRRTVQLFGWRVTQVMNLTDVDDKTIRNANAAGTSLRAYTNRFAEAFFEDLETLRVEPAEHYPRATDYIDQMVTIIQRLSERGHTYTSDGSIYYRISTFPEYGKLSGVSLENNIAGARIDADEYEKDDARDFVLWKASRPGEPSWDTPIGAGRPGWHLECSAMSMSLLGESFDIHTGAVDNIFPHHENEIAQSEGATGKPFARFWLHAEHLIVEGEKMAKSKGNFFTLRDLLEHGHDPAAIRYLLISVPYRQKLNFTFDGLHAANQAIERIVNTQRRLQHTPRATGDGDLALETVQEFHTDLADALGDDLNTARALAAVHTLLRAVNTALDGNGIAAQPRTELERAFTTIDATLGIAPQAAGHASDNDSAAIDALVAERTQARAERQFDRADAIRNELKSRGIVLEDTPHGTIWHREG